MRPRLTRQSWRTQDVAEGERDLQAPVELCTPSGSGGGGGGTGSRRAGRPLLRFCASQSVVRPPADWDAVVSDVVRLVKDGASGTGAPRVMVVGAKNAGKSTLLRMCVNSVLSASARHSPGAVLAFMDADPGQTEFTPPGAHAALPRQAATAARSSRHPRAGCRRADSPNPRLPGLCVYAGFVSLVLLSRAGAVVGPPHTHLASPLPLSEAGGACARSVELSIYIGAPSADGDPGRYRAALAALALRYEELSRAHACAWVPQTTRRRSLPWSIVGTGSSQSRGQWARGQGGKGGKGARAPPIWKARAVSLTTPKPQNKKR